MTRLLSADAQGIRAAAKLLQDGELVAFPTETVYGLGGDATNGAATAAIYTAKGRPSFNPLIVHVASPQAAAHLIQLPATGRRLAEAFWPGPLTMVAPLRAGAGIADNVTAGLPTLAVRVPANPLARELLEICGRPVAAPSANPSGRISPTTAWHVMEGLSGRIAAVLDGGACDVGLESTIIGFREGEPVLLRPGGFAAEDLEAIAGHLRDDDDATINAPGKLASHYAPSSSLRLNARAREGEELMLGFGNIAGDLNLSPSGDLEEAAANLFAYLRTLDSRAAGRPLAAAPVPFHGLGVAINDRLRRAAAPRPS